MKPARPIKSDDMAHALSTDPQLSMPEHPRFIDGIVTAKFGAGVVFDGCSRRQVLRGGSAHFVVDRLLPLLDGTRTIDEIHAELPALSRAQVFQALALLTTQGLLESGAVPAAQDRDDHHSHFEKLDTRLWLGRVADRVGVVANGEEALLRLDHVRLVVVCEAGDVWNQLRADLTAGGISQLDRIDFGELPSSDFDMIVAVVPGDAPDLDMYDQAARDAAKTMLRVGWTPDTVIVGPWIDHRHTPCWSCSVEAPLDDAHVVMGEPAADYEGINALLAASLAATEIVGLCSRTTPASTSRSMSVIDVASWNRSHRVPMRRWGCPTCTDLEGDAPAGDPVTFAYEQTWLFPPLDQIDAKQHLEHYRPSNVALQADPRKVPALDHLQLTTVDTSRVQATLRDGDTQFDQARLLDADMLATFVGIVGGVKEPQPGQPTKRWAPTGGNMGSVELSVLVRNVPGVEAGAYLYEPQSHRLYRAPAEPDAVRALDVVGSDHDLVVVYSGAFERIMTKYAALAVRIIYLDAGFALSQSRMVANALGWTFTAFERWDDDLLGRTFGFDPLTAPITGMAGLKGPHSVA